MVLCEHPCDHNHEGHDHDHHYHHEDLVMHSISTNGHDAAERDDVNVSMIYSIETKRKRREIQ